MTHFSWVRGGLCRDFTVIFYLHHGRHSFQRLKNVGTATDDDDDDDVDEGDGGNYSGCDAFQRASFL